MSKLVRISLSIEETLLNKFEKLVSQKGYDNRSEFIRDMIRDSLVEEEWNEEAEVVATITMIFDHAKRELSKKITKLQHAHHGIVLASTHVHLTEHICAEMIMVKGNAAEIRELADELRQQKGVLHSGLIMGTTGKMLIC